MTTQTIPPQLVKELRERTGAGFMDCKRALEETGGDLAKAVDLLRERGHQSAAKKVGREVREGLVGSYIHTGGRVGVLIEVNCETDFVARNEQFQKLVRDLAIQVAGYAPEYVTVDAIPPDVLEAKRTELGGSEPELKKWIAQAVLYEQPYRDEHRTVGELITEAIATIGENIRVRRFARYAVGEEA